MANNRFNKQVTPKGYMKGGRVKKMGGGMMMQRPMAEGGYITKKKTSKYITRKETKPKYITRKEKTGPYITKKKKYITKKSPAEIQDRERVGRKMGGSLKPVNPQTQKGLSKLPTEVRNKMGYMKKGGKVNGK